MKIRQKITLWIAGTILFAGVGLSGFIFHELLEEPYKLIDNELRHMAEPFLKEAEVGRGHIPASLTASILPFPPDQYWIMVMDDSGAQLYHSKLTEFVDIPVSNEHKTYNVEKKVSRRLVQIGQDTKDEVLFRVQILRRELADKSLTVVIAKPIEALEEEVDQLIFQMSAGFGAYILLIVIVSYFLAGRILKPIVQINVLARKISELSLEQRIPLGKNRDELYDLTVSLNRMFDRLQFSFARQKEFVGNAAHELKSPITLLMLAQENLAQHQPIDESLRADLVQQMDILRRMKRLVKNLLDLSRLEQQENIHFDKVDLHTLVESVLVEYEAMIETGSIQVDNHLIGPLIVDGDQEKLYRLFINLFDNAWRYNKEQDGVIRITGKRVNGRVSLVVANTGPGVPADESQKVFEQFYRLEKSRSLSQGGSGLGLTIAKKIVDLHDGTIELVSEEDGWTRVTVSLPAKA